MALPKKTDALAAAQKRLLSTPTAMTPGTTPTSSQLSADTAFRQRLASKSSELEARNRERWAYPQQDQEPKASALENAVKFLQAPMSAIAGAVETATGTGTKKGLLENVVANVEEGGTYGDIIRSKGGSNWVAAPLGFALDVALDPATWLSAGTTAIVPRLAKGAVKGGLSGTAAAAKSWGLNKAEGLVAMTSPSYRRMAFLKDDALSEFPEWMRTLGDRTATANRRYAELAADGADAIGRTVKARDGMVGQAIASSKAAVKEAYEKGVSLSWRDRIKNFLYYSADDDLAETMTKESAERAESAAVAGAAGPVTPYQKRRASSVSSVTQSTDEARKVLHRNQIVADGLDTANGKLPGRSMDSADNALRLADDAVADAEVRHIVSSEIRKKADDLVARRPDGVGKFSELSAADKDDALTIFTSLKTDIDSYDAAVLKMASSSPIVRKMMTGYLRYVGAFKSMAVGASPSAWVNGIGGNALLGMLYGIDTMAPSALSAFRSAKRIVVNGDVEHMRKLVGNEATLKLMREYPETFQAIFGVNPDFIRHRTGWFAMAKADLRSDGVPDEILRGIDKYADKLQGSVDAGVIDRQIAERAAGSSIPAIRAAEKSDLRRSMATFSAIRNSEVPSTMISEEITLGVMGKWLREIERDAAAGDLSAKALRTLLTKPMSGYSKIDQTAKLGTFLHLTGNGITEGEAVKLAKMMKFGDADFIRSSTGNLYRLTPEAAMRAANEIYLNYLALPGFVKMVRAVPFGASFACRSEDTEILTSTGWKTYDEVKVGDLALSMNIVTEELEWKPIEAVNVYDFDGELQTIIHRSLDILMTDNHRCLVSERKKSKGKEYRQLCYREAKDLKKSDEIIVGAKNGFKGVEEEVVEDDWVELVGWFVTEGFYKNKKADGGWSSFAITQSKPDGVRRIMALRDRLGVKNHVGVMKAETFNARANRNSKANFDLYTFCFDASFKAFMDIYAPNKSLTIKFLNRLSRRQLELLYEVLLLADGSVNKKTGDSTFIQNRGETLDSFQVLCLMLGKSSGVSLKPCGGAIAIKANKRIVRLPKAKGGYSGKAGYVGKVWCPSVKDNENWVARRNLKIDITGNSFSYAVSHNLLKGLGINPEFYNRVNYAIREASGAESPLERKVLQSKYGQHLDQPGMLRLNFPFLKDNPAYLNLQNMIPHMSLNFLDDGRRAYAKQLPTDIVRMIDANPFLAKDPVGGLLLNYVLLPMATGEAIGAFGQRLYPEDSGLLEKAGLFAKGAAEPLVPKLAGTAGAFTLPLPDVATPYVPSYSYQVMRNALLGRNPQGYSTQESATSRSIRALLSQVAGLPISKMNVKYGNE